MSRKRPDVFIGLMVATVFTSVASAGSSYLNFNSDPAPYGYLRLYGGARWAPGDGASGNEFDGAVALAPATPCPVGGMVVGDLDFGLEVLSFHLEAQIRLETGQIPEGAGLCLSLVTPEDPLLNDAAWQQASMIPFETAGRPETGSQTGLAFCLEPGADGAVLNVRSWGAVLGRFSIPKGDSSDGGFRWHRLSVYIQDWPAPDLFVSWDEQRLTPTTGLATAFPKTPLRLLAAASGGETAWAPLVDDLMLTTIPQVCAQIGSGRCPPRMRICRLPDGSIQVGFEGSLERTATLGSAWLALPESGRMLTLKPTADSAFFRSLVKD
jgi:hypothetical protein